MSNQIKTLDEFIEKQNNFRFHFLKKGIISDIYRSRIYFKKFKKENPKLEEDLTEKVTEINKEIRTYPTMEEFTRQLPNQDLFLAYNLMCNFITSGYEKLII